MACPLPSTLLPSGPEVAGSEDLDEVTPEQVCDDDRVDIVSQQSHARVDAAPPEAQAAAAVAIVAAVAVEEDASVKLPPQAASNGPVSGVEVSPLPRAFDQPTPTATVPATPSGGGGIRRTIVFSQLAAEEKEKVVKFLIKNRVDFEASTKNKVFHASLHVEKNCNRVRLTTRHQHLVSGSWIDEHEGGDPLSPASTGYFPKTQADEVERQIVSRCRELRERFPSLCSQLRKPKQLPKALPRASLLRFVEDAYTARYQYETKMLLKDTSNHTCMKPETPLPRGSVTAMDVTCLPKSVGSGSLQCLSFPDFVRAQAKKRHGVGPLVDVGCWDVVNSVDILRDRAGNACIEVFARFLDETYGDTDMLLFLYARDVAYREPLDAVALAKGAITGSAATNLIHATPVDKMRCTLVVNRVFASKPQLAQRILKRVDAELLARKNKCSHFRHDEFLATLVEEFHNHRVSAEAAKAAVETTAAVDAEALVACRSALSNGSLQAGSIATDAHSGTHATALDTRNHAASAVDDGASGAMVDAKAKHYASKSSSAVVDSAASREVEQDDDVVEASSSAQVHERTEGLRSAPVGDINESRRDEAPPAKQHDAESTISPNDVAKDAATTVIAPAPTPAQSCSAAKTDVAATESKAAPVATRGEVPAPQEDVPRVAEPVLSAPSSETAIAAPGAMANALVDAKTAATSEAAGVSPTLVTPSIAEPGLATVSSAPQANSAEPNLAKGVASSEKAFGVDDDSEAF
eukprot:TRINITY_DN15778_c0_g1_i1.p1 TRINITY_DN15778_c0_g1~~TRINITY_DN15778_c0_g1_i1.p1  ORF type:complete len:750 (-),score=129.92 TRINITY_DN15778_c0_g1_i1:62-2311(-)